MAYEVEITKNVLDVLSEASELTSQFAAVSNVLEITSKFASVFPLVGAILAVVQSSLPNKNHEEILGCFEKLSNKIDNVRDDIRELEKTIKWENVKLQYGDAVNQITLGMDYCLEIGKATEEDSKKRYQEKLKELCSNQEFTLALRELMDGIIGNGLFRSSILDEFYEKTKGHRPKISALSNRLLQLVSGGMMVNAAYEATVRGEKGAREMMKGFEERISKVNSKVRSVLDKCENNFEEHMLPELNHYLDKNGYSNQALVYKLCGFMRKKYDWLELYCLVYDDLFGSDKHWLRGYMVESLHRNGKCGVIFYRTADETPRFSHRYYTAYKIVDDVNCYNAKGCSDSIVRSLASRGIGWTGCAIVRRTANLRLKDNFSTRTVYMVGMNAYAILMLE